MAEPPSKFKLTWKLAFFLAACCIVAGAVISIVHLVLSLTWGPFSFMNQIYLLLFGFLMLALDFPIENHNIMMARKHIYSFVLFMSRFTGRGLWYMFLGTMVFGSLWGQSISPFLGFCLAGYIIIVGAVSIVFGIWKSLKLDKVRQALRSRGSTEAAPSGGFDAESFQAMVNQVQDLDVKFSEEELHYVVNALSSDQHTHGEPRISDADIKDWLRDGKMMLV